MVGGIASEIGGGRLVSGFLAGGFGSLADAAPLGDPVSDTIEHAVAGGVGSVLGGGKFANGAVTGAFGYLFNEALHATDVGNDAHQTLLDYGKAQGTGFFGNTWWDPTGDAWFGGRPDLGNVNLADLWEVKPLWDWPSGRIQVEFYSVVSGSYSVAEAAPSFFEGDTLTLPGKYGSYTYTFVGEGVIGYTSRLYEQNYIVPQIIPLFRSAPKISPFEILRSLPDVAPVVP